MGRDTTSKKVVGNPLSISPVEAIECEVNGYLAYESYLIVILVRHVRKLRLNLSKCYGEVWSYATKLTIKNNCNHTIWPATQTSQGATISTGFELESKASQTLEVPNSWSGRLWARYLCAQYGRNFTCVSGDCASGQITCNGAGGIPPITIVQFTLASWSGANDFYSNKKSLKYEIKVIMSLGAKAHVWRIGKMIYVALVYGLVGTIGRGPEELRGALRHRGALGRDREE
ncbi:PREDICTED: thaumatin-like protein [Nicotiana attenuata]|uniref:thaumatin-like protein n=1 Tax=Nicotiana attenuata TaxID=49451 RepID=UPI00090525A8|nr:PREDICTED: thaumatin-like protein [Nicotiana attenuata]